MTALWLATGAGLLLCAALARYTRRWRTDADLRDYGYGRVERE